MSCSFRISEIRIFGESAVFFLGLVARRGGAQAASKPSFAASLSRKPAWLTDRTSPASPISPNITVSAESGWSSAADIRAAATARSAAGSPMRRPPATLRYTSCPARPMPQRDSRTASTIARRPESQPITARRGVPNADGATSACISTKTGRVPSMPAISRAMGNSGQQRAAAGAGAALRGGSGNSSAHAPRHGCSGGRAVGFHEPIAELPVSTTAF